MPAWDPTRATPPGWRRTRAQVLKAHANVCWLCQHPDATELDHIVNVAAGGTHEVSNLAPIHGTAYGADPCPHCGRACHAEKTQRERAEGTARARAKALKPREGDPGLIDP
jgi:hypothetical protein